MVRVTGLAADSVMEQMNKSRDESIAKQLLHDIEMSLVGLCREYANYIDQLIIVMDQKCEFTA